MPKEALHTKEDFGLVGRRTCVQVHEMLGRWKAQGAGFGESVGILRDRAGDDVYVATAEERIEATLDDRMSSPDAPPRLDVRSYPPASLYAQGVAVLFSHGALVDEGGTDSYAIRSTNTVSASATSERATGVPAVTAMTEPRWFAAGQGAGDFGGLTGALLDLRGSGDRFESVAMNPAEKAPDPDGAFQPAAPWPYVQGAFGGVLLALGDDPLVLSNPSRRVCPASPGARGFGAWNDCALSGADPGLQLFDQTPIQTQHSLGRAEAAAGLDAQIAFLPGKGRLDVRWAPKHRVPVQWRRYLPDPFLSEGPERSRNGPANVRETMGNVAKR